MITGGRRSEQLALVQALAKWRSLDDPATGLEEFRAAFGQTDAKLDNLIRWSRTIGVSMFVLSAALAIQAILVPLSLQFTLAIGAFLCSIAGIVIWQYPVLLQMGEAKGYVPQFLTLASLQFVHEFRALCLKGNVSVADVQTGPVDLSAFASAWAIVLFSERPRVRSLFLVAAGRAFKRQLVATLHCPEITDLESNRSVLSPNASQMTAGQNENTGTAPETSDRRAVLQRNSVARGKRPRSSEEKRAYLADLNAEQRARGVAQFLRDRDIVPRNHYKYELVVEILWQEFRDNRRDDYEISLAIEKAKKAVQEEFGSTGLAGKNSDAWIKKIAYGTNRELREQLEFVRGQLKLGLANIVQISPVEQ